jgi:hypothetical protein
MVHNLGDYTIFLRTANRVAVSLSVSVEFHQTLELFVDSFKKVVIHTTYAPELLGVAIRSSPENHLLDTPSTCRLVDQPT